MKKLILIGNVGADAIIRTNPQTGEQFATFSIATKYKDKTSWTQISCNKKLKDVAEAHIKKGTQIYVEGLPGINKYATKDGEFVAELTCFATSIQLLSRPPVNDQNLPAIEEEINPEDITF